MDSNEQANIVTDPMGQATCPSCNTVLDVSSLPPFTGVQCPSCGASFQVPALFGPFVLLQRLGQGGMGGVYRGRDTGLNREVAIKVMLKSLGDDPQFVESFQREAQAAARLNNPNIAQIYSFGREKGQPYISMELITGGSLDKMMAKQGPLDPGVVIHIGRQIASGLSDAADAGLVHGDVKPENILFDADQNAKLVDFGLAAMLNPNNEVWGTPFYIAPEKVRRLKTDFRADIYSLGGTLYHAICNKPPYDGPDATAVVKARFEEPYHPMVDIRGEANSPELEAIIQRMLEVDPAKRYPTYRSLLNDMDKYLQSCGPIKMKQKEKKKFVIKGSNAAKAAESGDRPASGKPDAPEEEPDDSADSHRGCKLFALIGVGVLLLAVLSAGGIFAYLHHTKVAKERAEFAQLEQEEGKTRANIAKFVTVAREHVKKLEAFPKEAGGYAKEAGDLTAGVLGETVRAQFAADPGDDLPLPAIFAKVDAAFSGQPQIDEAKPAGTNAQAKAEDKTDAKTGGAKPGADLEAMAKAFEAKLIPALAKKGLMLDDIEKLSQVLASPNAPQPKKIQDYHEVMSGLQNELTPLLEACLAAMAAEEGKGAKEAKMPLPGPLRKMFGGGKMPTSDAYLKYIFTSMVQEAAKAGAADAKTADAKTADAGEAADEAPETPPVVKLVKGMFDDAAQVGRAFKLAKAMLAKIEEHARLAEKFDQVSSEHRDQLVKLNNFLKEEVDNLAYAKPITEIPRRCAGLKKAIESVKNELNSLLALQKQQKLEAEKKAKAEADAEKKRQATEALKAKTDAECQKVAEAENTAAVPLRALDFRQAKRTIQNIKDELETDGGTTAFLVALERVQRLENFHKYLSGNVVGYKSVKGWTITGSDAKTLTVGGSKIPWKTVYNEKMAIFAELVINFVSSEKTKGLHLRERSRLKTNAAIALSLFYPSNDSAMKLARKLANEAAAQFDADADDIKALVPKFFTEEPAPATGD